MDIEFYCFKCGQHILIDAAGAGQVVNCPKCQAALVVPNAQVGQSPVCQDESHQSPPRKPKRRLGLVLGVVGVVLVLLAILCVILIARISTTHTQDTLAVAQTRVARMFTAPTQDTLAIAQTRGDVVKQLESVLKRFVSLNPVRANFDSVEFDVTPTPSGSIVSPYIGEVDYVMPAQVSSFCWQPPTSTTIVNCRVHFTALFAYQDGRWVFKELEPDKNRAWSECNGCPSFNLIKRSQELMEQHKQWWQKATAR